MIDYDSIVLALAEWFTGNAADTPWRRTRDPWHILVSEIMLQQTRVKTVVPIYEAFIQQFPTPAALAQASEETLLQAWQGLGYYRRAHLLQRAARALVDQWGSQLPDTPEALQTLPGIGAYTSRSVAAIAFSKPAMPVDGNVARVLARVHKRRKADRQIPQAWDRGLRLALQQTNPGHAVQAMMEVGSTICLPVHPRCETCPLQQWCASHKAASAKPASAFDAQGYRWGRAAIRKPPSEEHWHALVILRNDGAVLMTYRTQGLLSSQWGLPMFAPADTPEAALQGKLAGTVQHQFTHRVWQVQVYRLLLESVTVPDWLKGERARWSTRPDKDLPSKAFRKILARGINPPGTSQ